MHGVQPASHWNVLNLWIILKIVRIQPYYLEYPYNLAKDFGDFDEV